MLRSGCFLEDPLWDGFGGASRTPRRLQVGSASAPGTDDANTLQASVHIHECDPRDGRAVAAESRRYVTQAFVSTERKWLPRGRRASVLLLAQGWMERLASSDRNSADLLHQPAEVFRR